MRIWLMCSGTYSTPLTQYFPTARLDYNMRDNLRLFLSLNMTK